MRWLADLWRWLGGRGETARRDGEAGNLVRPATWTDVETVASLLEKHAADYVLVGGYALVANGLIRATGDVDILVRNTPENNRRWIAALGELPDAAAAELAGEDNPFPADDEAAGEAGVIRIFDVFIIDVMPKACGLTYEDLLPHVARLTEGGKSVNVLDMAGLLRTKQGVRDKDRSDREQLEMALARIGGR